MDPHRAYLLLLGSRVRFNPTPTFLGVTFDRTLSFSKHVSSLKAKFFPDLKALLCISASSWGQSKKFLSVLYKDFLRLLLTYASPGWFPFLSVTNITKLERIQRTTITGCLSSSPIPLLLSKASLPPLRVTLTYFTLSSYERALRLSTFFPISGLARLEVKPRLCRSSWRAFASTHPLMLASSSPTEALLACPPSPSWNLPAFTVKSTLSSSCSRSDLPLTRQDAALAHLDPLPLTIWCFGLRALFLLLLAKTALVYLPIALFVAPSPLFLFSVGPVCSSFCAETCAIMHALCWSRQHQQVCHFSSLLLLSGSRSVLISRSSPPFLVLHQTLLQIWQ